VINYLDLQQPYEGHACKDISKDVFFPVHQKGDYRPYKAAIEAAKAICRTCPLQMRCFRDAKARNEQFGIWGGVNFSSRPRRNEQAFEDTDTSICGTEAGWRRHAEQIKKGGYITCEPCLNARAEATRSVR
jgi:WhiB family redox-sensing transcriptional regulator